MLKKLLRYNTRHNLYYHPTYKDRYGAKNFFGWSLNPMSSSYDGKQKSFHEPLWMFRLRQRLFACAGRQSCPSRSGDMRGIEHGKLPDSWNWGPDGARTCSYCGSLHPEDWTDIMWRYSQREEGYSFDMTDKGYKDYGHRPGVQNASQGGIKFYGWHVPPEADPLHDELYAARSLAFARWRADMQERWGPKAV